MYCDHIHHPFPSLILLPLLLEPSFFNHIFLLIPCLYPTGLYGNTMMGSLPMATPLNKSDCSFPSKYYCQLLYTGRCVCVCVWSIHAGISMGLALSLLKGKETDHHG